MDHKNSLKTAITIIVSLAFASLFMWLALKGLDFDKIKASLSQANYFWVAISALFGILAYWFRAIRWNLLLEPMGYRISNSNAFWAIAFGYLMNLTIPRSGEVARSTALFGVEKVPVEKSFATIVIERIVDLAFMLFFLLLTFLFNGNVLKIFFNRLTHYQSTEKKELSATDQFLMNNGIENIDQFYFWVEVSVLVVGILGFIFALSRFKNKILEFAKGLIDGLKSVLQLKEKGKFIVYSAGIWMCYFLSAYLACFALQETSFLSISDGFLIITAGTLGMMVPISGGAGSFHIAVKLAIAGIFVSLGKSEELGEEIGLSYAFISHTMQLVYMLVVGFIAIPFLAKARNK